MIFIKLLVEIVLLLIGAELFINSATSLVKTLKVSPMLIGLTVVAFGTSLPELGISIEAAITNKPSIALTNVVGSNIFNLLFIVNISALISPPTVHIKYLKIDMPFKISLQT